MAAQYCSVGIFFESQSSDLLVHHRQRVAKHRHCQVDSLAAALVQAAAAGRHQSHRSYHHQAQKVTHHQQNHQLEWSPVEVAEVLVAGLALRTCHEMELVYYGRAVAEVLVVAEAYSPARRDHMPAAAQETVLVVAG